MTEPRFKPHNVLRFVEIVKILQNSPKEIHFNPTPLRLSVDTACARLRDAILALSTGLVQHPDINSDLLAKVWPRYKVIADGEFVSVVPRQTEKETSVSVHPSDVESPALSWTLSAEHRRFCDSLRAFAVLLGERLLTGQLTIKGQLDPKLQKQIEQDNDVVFRKVDKQTTIML